MASLSYAAKIPQACQNYCKNVEQSICGENQISSQDTCIYYNLNTHLLSTIIWFKILQYMFA